MPLAKYKSIVSFSSEDKVHKAENLLKSSSDGKWRCSTPGEKQAWVVIQLEKAVSINSVDIGNDGSAFIEVLVSRGSNSESYKVLLVASSFMSPTESRSGSGSSRVRMFGRNKLCSDTLEEKWDHIKVVCTQPFNKHSTYGLHFVNVHTTDQKTAEVVPAAKDKKDAITATNSGEKTRASFGAFKLKPEIAEEHPPSARDPPNTSTKNSDDIKTKVENLKRKMESAASSTDVKKSKVLPTTSTDVETEKVPSTSQSRKIAKITADDQKISSMPPSSKNKPGKRRKREFSKLLEGVVFVLSGYQNPERGAIRDKALLMGAQYKRDWERECTHLICAFRNTPKYQQVMGRNGRIVKAEWINDCYAKKIRLPRKDYNLKPDDSDESSFEEDDEDDPDADPYEASTDEEDSPDTEDEIERVRHQKTENEASAATKDVTDDPYDTSTDEEKSTEDNLPLLPEYFQDVTFYLHGDFDHDVGRMLKRHIIVSAGSIVHYMNDDVRYVVTESPWLKDFDDAIDENPSLKFVRPMWVFECGQARGLLPCEMYAVR